MEPTKLSEWKLVGPRRIDVGHGIVIELDYGPDLNTYKAYVLDHVIAPLFAASEALYKAGKLTLKQLDRADSIRSSQIPARNALRAALNMVPPVDETMLEHVLLQLSKGKK